MDIRAEKLAKARKKLKDHQEKKTVLGQKEVLDEPVQKSLATKSIIDQESKDMFHDNLKCSTPDSSTEFLQKQTNEDKHYSDVKPEVITEMLITNKTNLELQINNLNSKLNDLEHLYENEISNHNMCKQRNAVLQSEINTINVKLSSLLQDSMKKDEDISKLNGSNQILYEEKNNLSEQLEFTKSMLTTKEAENAHLHEEIQSYQSKLRLFQLQLQQLTSGAMDSVDGDGSQQETEALLEKISFLEEKVAMLQNDKEQLHSHYNHFVREQSDQLKIYVQKYEDTSKELERMYDRENSLIDQISNLEIRLQNSNFSHETELKEKEDFDLELQNKCMAMKKELDEVNVKYNELQVQHTNCLKRIEELSKTEENKNQDQNNFKHDNVDLTKLTADMASDKLAAQRATEQNEKLKFDVQSLEQVIVKMGKDKLELTEMWTHEKELNRGLALKLAEVEENAKIIQTQLKAKDDEMIRLLNEYREVQKIHEISLRDIGKVQTTDTENVEDNSDTAVESNGEVAVVKHNIEDERKQLTPIIRDSNGNKELDIVMHKEDAMMKLQKRFLNIMDEVANLSDEKHRLEHIILQLQNETDTICEYVALYQQQRSLLKKREEERSNHLKIFQVECDKLKSYLEELRRLLLRFAADEGLASILKEETRLNDFVRVTELLEKLQNSTLINPIFNNLDLNIFYPCSCCSGQLIDV